MSAPDDTTAPAELAEDSSVKSAFTAFELAFDAWISDAWPLCDPGSVGWHQRREAFRVGFETGVGFAT